MTLTEQEIDVPVGDLRLLPMEKLEELRALALSALRAEQQPVAWRFRYSINDLWSYIPKAGETERILAGKSSELCQPLYASPAAQSGMVSVPAGWIAVPREPTDEWARRIAELGGTYYHTYTLLQLKNMIRDVLSSVPAAPAEKDKT